MWQLSATFSLLMLLNTAKLNVSSEQHNMWENNGINLIKIIFVHLIFSFIVYLNINLRRQFS